MGKLGENSLPKQNVLSDSPFSANVSSNRSATFHCRTVNCQSHLVNVFRGGLILQSANVSLCWDFDGTVCWAINCKQDVELVDHATQFKLHSNKRAIGCSYSCLHVINVGYMFIYFHGFYCVLVHIFCYI